MNKFSCGRTKAEAIILNVLTPFFKNLLTTDLSAVNFVIKLSDASNHKDLKLFLTVIWYFQEESGINVKVIQLVNLPGETAEIIANSLVQI